MMMDRLTAPGNSTPSSQVCRPVSGSTMITNAVMNTKVSALMIHSTWNRIQAIAKSEKYRMIRDAEARIMSMGSRNRQNQNSEKLTLQHVRGRLGIVLDHQDPASTVGHCVHPPPEAPCS